MKVRFFCNTGFANGTHEEILDTVEDLGMYSGEMPTEQDVMDWVQNRGVEWGCEPLDEDPTPTPPPGVVSKQEILDCTPNGAHGMNVVDYLRSRGITITD